MTLLAPVQGPLIGLCVNVIVNWVYGFIKSVFHNQTLKHIRIISWTFCMDLETKAAQSTALDLAAHFLNWQILFGHTWSPCNKAWRKIK